MNSMLSPTATGFVVLIPDILSFPRMRQSQYSSLSVSILYQLPVDFMTVPVFSVLFFSQN